MDKHYTKYCGVIHDRKTKSDENKTQAAKSLEIPTYFTKVDDTKFKTCIHPIHPIDSEYKSSAVQLIIIVRTILLIIRVFELKYIKSYRQNILHIPSKFI